MGSLKGIVPTRALVRIGACCVVCLAVSTGLLLMFMASGDPYELSGGLLFLLFFLLSISNYYDEKKYPDPTVEDMRREIAKIGKLEEQMLEKYQLQGQKDGQKQEIGTSKKEGKEELIY